MTAGTTLKHLNLVPLLMNVVLAFALEELQHMFESLVFAQK